MRKIQRTMEATEQRCRIDVEPGDRRQRKLSITFQPKVNAVDLITLLSKPAAEATVAGSLTRQEPTKQESDHLAGMLALSDGTQVKFARIGQFTVVQGN